MGSMRLGAETGSVMNHIMSRQTKGQPEPVVGMAATLLLWSDRHAATIISVEKQGKDTIIGVQHDHAKLTSGSIMSEAQTYDYSPNPEGRIEYFRHKNEAWESVRRNEETGRWNKTGNGGIKIGVREEYRDPSF